MPICPKYSISGVTVSITLDTLHGEKIGEAIPPSEELFFDVNAKLNEQKRSSREVLLSFNLLIGTKPNVAKYVASGTVSLEGDMKDVSKRLETDPKTNVPKVLFTVYQHIFSAIYLLSSVLKTPYPPPDLLHSMQERIQITVPKSDTELSRGQSEKSQESVETANEAQVSAGTTSSSSSSTETAAAQPHPKGT